MGEFGDDNEGQFVNPEELPELQLEDEPVPEYAPPSEYQRVELEPLLPPVANRPRKCYVCGVVVALADYVEIPVCQRCERTIRYPVTIR